MTTVTFHASNGRMDGVVVDGHSGYADAGSDIVCAAISYRGPSGVHFE